MDLLDAFLDGVTGAGLFGKLRWPGAPTEFIDSRSPEEFNAKQHALAVQAGVLRRRALDEARSTSEGQPLVTGSALQHDRLMMAFASNRRLLGVRRKPAHRYSIAALLVEIVIPRIAGLFHGLTGDEVQRLREKTRHGDF